MVSVELQLTCLMQYQIENQQSCIGRNSNMEREKEKEIISRDEKYILSQNLAPNTVKQVNFTETFICELETFAIFAST